jgi:Zn-dependent metalloprotease
MKNLLNIAKKAGILSFIVVLLGLSLFLILYSGIVVAKQDNKPKSNENVASNGIEMKKDHNFDYSVDKNTGKINYIKAINDNQSLSLAEYSSKNPTPAGISSQFIAEYGSYFGLSNPSEETKLVGERKDDLAISHFWYDQKYKGIPVFAGQMAVHVKDNLSVSSANGIVVSDINVDTNPTISKEKAVEKAINAWGKQFKVSEVDVLNTELMIFNKGIVENKADNNNYLVYEVELMKKPVRHEYYYIDAHDGNIVYQITGTYNSISRNIWDCYYYPHSGGTGCGLDVSHAGYTYGRSEGQPARGASPDANYELRDVDDLYNIMNSTHNYFSEKFSRNGANNQGGLGDDVVGHAEIEDSDGWVYLDPIALAYNTFECPNAFFDGFSINFCDGLVYTDVAAHEYGHGVVHYSISGGLTYTYESGAIHEAYADIFGDGVEDYVTGNGNWLMGEDVDITGLTGPIRSLADPESINDGLGPQPNRFYSDFMYCGATDYGGVHHNSTIISHAAYLMAEGGNNNTCTISAIGRDKMEQIFYRALTNYFTTNIDFNGAFNALNAACADLYGASSSTCVAANQALMSTEINQGGRCSSEVRVIPGCGDTTSPEITGQNPANGSDGATRNTNISFKINDNNAGINPASIYVTINNKDVIANSTFFPGYSITMTPNDSNGYNASINPTEIFDNNEEVTVEVEVADNNNNSITSSWSFAITDLPIDPKILTTSGPGEVTRLQAYSRQGETIGSEINNIFPSTYLGGAGIIPIDANNNGIRDQIVVFASYNGGPQARTLGLKEDGSMSFLGQMFVFDSNIRDGLSMTSGDFDGDGFQDDVATCLTGNRAPNVRIYKDIIGVDTWEMIGDFTAPYGNVGCNLGTFQYDSGPDEILVAPNHGPADPYVYIYTAGGTLKEYFLAYGEGVINGLTPSGIEDRIYTTPNNGSSHIMAYDKDGNRKNFWWAYEKHVKGDFKNMPGDIDLDGKDEILISPIGSNGPQVLAFEPTGKWRTWPNFFAFGDETLRNGVGIAVVDNFHGAN